MAPHSSTLAWKIPWMEEPDGLQSMGLRRVGHDWATSLSCTGEGNGNPLQCSCLEIPGTGEPGGLLSMGSRRVRLKRLSSSSSRMRTSPVITCLVLMWLLSTRAYSFRGQWVYRSSLPAKEELTSFLQRPCGRGSHKAVSPCDQLTGAGLIWQIW